MKRNRLYYFLAVWFVIALGLASRRYAAQLPAFVGNYAGDVLWAFMVYLGAGFLFPRWPAWRIALLTLLFSYAVELSQLYHAPWLDALRQTSFGGLVLGLGFLWTDLLCYTVGVTLGLTFELALTKVIKNNSTPSLITK